MWPLETLPLPCVWRKPRGAASAHPCAEIPPSNRHTVVTVTAAPWWLEFPFLASAGLIDGLPKLSRSAQHPWWWCKSLFTPLLSYVFALPRIIVSSKLAPKAAASIPKGYTGWASDSSHLAFPTLWCKRGCVLSTETCWISHDFFRNTIDSIRIRTHNLLLLFKLRKQYHILCQQATMGYAELFVSSLEYLSFSGQ